MAGRKGPGAVLRAGNVLVVLLIMAVLIFGVYVALLSFATPGSGFVLPAIDGFRGRSST